MVIPAITFPINLLYHEVYAPKGLIASESLKKGEVVAIKDGHIIDKETLNKYAEIIADSATQITDKFYLAPLKKSEYKDVMIFIKISLSLIKF